MSQLSEFYNGFPLKKEVINYQDYVSKNSKYISPAVEGIPLIASSVYPDTTEVKKWVFNDAINAGFNAGLHGSSFNGINCAMNALEEALDSLKTHNKTESDSKLNSESTSETESHKNFNLLIANPDLNNRVNIYFYLSRFKNRSNFGGWDYADEIKFDNLQDRQKCYYILKELDPTHTVFCNLWGWQTKREEKTTSLEGKETITTFDVPVEEYVQKFQELYHPGFWSYDMYPIGYEFDVNDKNYQTLHNFIGDEGQKEGNWYKDFINSKINSGALKPSFEVRMDLYERLKACPGKLKANNRAFYWDLELYSRMSYITGRPFYAFCETMAYWNFDKSPDKHPYMRPRPTINFLRFEAFSALAYGANGIVFWTYCMREQRTIKTAAKDESATYEILLASIAETNGKIERLADLPSHGDKLAPDTYDVV